MRTHGVVEQFDFQVEAVRFFELTLYNYAAEGWETIDGSGIFYKNHRWTVDMKFESGAPNKIDPRELPW